MLDKMRVRINKHYQEIMERDNFVTAEKVKTPFELEHRYHTLMQVFRSQRGLCQAGGGWHESKGTLLKYKTVYKHLQEFLTIRYRVKDIALKELTPAFISDFEMFLRRTSTAPTPCGCMSALRTMVFIAINNEWLTRDPFREGMKSRRKKRPALLTRGNPAADGGQTKNAKQEYTMVTSSPFTGLSFADMQPDGRNIPTYFDEHGGSKDFWNMVNNRRSQLQYPSLTAWVSDKLEGKM